MALFTSMFCSNHVSTSQISPFFMVALQNRADHYIFALWFLRSHSIFTKILIFGMRKPESPDYNAELTVRRAFSQLDRKTACDRQRTTSYTMQHIHFAYMWHDKERRANARDLSETIDNANGCRCPSTKNVTNQKVDSTTLHITAFTYSNCTQNSHQRYTGCQYDDQHRKSQTGISLLSHTNGTRSVLTECKIRSSSKLKNNCNCF